MSSGFRECRDLRAPRDPQDRRVTLENQDCQALKGQEDPQEHLVTLETQDFLVFLARMGPRVPQASRDATGQRVREDRWDLRVCLDLPEILDHQGCPA